MSEICQMLLEILVWIGCSDLTNRRFSHDFERKLRKL
jgi:hypothetical protein